MTHCLERIPSASRRVVRLAPVMCLAFLACTSTRNARAASRTVSGASPTTSAGDACTPTKTGARLGRVVIAFAGASGGQANVRLEGVNAYKSTVLVDVSTGTVLELDEGNYELRVTLSGYRAVERTVSALCGKERTVTIQLDRR